MLCVFSLFGQKGNSEREGGGEERGGGVLFR